MNRYCRADVLRILHITPQQMAGWERAGLVPVQDSYTFFDLIQLKKVRELRERKVRPAVIRQSLEAMQKQVAGLENPLVQAGAFPVGHRVAFRHQGVAMEPIAGQYMMDFGQVGRIVAANVKSIQPTSTAAELFSRGVALEEDPHSYEEAILVYQQVLELEPEHAAAHINLGTLSYNRGDFRTAETHYRRAIEIDPRYALAYFDLGNVLDETGRLPEAIEAYLAAITLAPTYADAHYNLALAYEKCKKPRKALKHWRTYIRLDATSPWAVHARKQIQRTLDSDQLKIVYRR